MREEPDVDKVITIAEKARSQLDATIRIFERMLELNRRAIPAMRLYGTLCLEVLGDLTRAQELFSAADAVAKEDYKLLQLWSYREFGKPIDVTLDILDERNAVVSVYVNPENVGTICGVNAAFLKMLEIPRADFIIGRNINLIIAEPIRSYHDRLILDYSASRASSIVGSTSLLMALHAHGHLVPSAVYLRWADKAEGKMIAALQPLSNPHEIAMFIDSATLKVAYATQNLASVFGFSKRNVLAQKVMLFDILPELRDENFPDLINEKVQRALVRALHTT